MDEVKDYHQIAILQSRINQERYFKKLKLILIFALILLSFYLWENRPKIISVDKAFLAMTIIWLGFFPSIQYLLDRKRPPIPFFPLVGLFYATSFGLPIFSKELAVLVVERSSLRSVNEQSLIWVMLGVLGMNISFYISKSSLWSKISPVKLKRKYSLNKLILLIWLLLLLHFAAFFIPFIKTVPSLSQLLDPIGYLAFGLLYIVWSRCLLSFLQTWIFLGICLPIEVMYRLASGSLAQLMTLGLFMTLIIWYERKRIPVVLVSLSILVFVLLNPIKYEYRTLTWSGSYSNSSPIEKVQLFIGLTIDYYSNLGSGSKKKEVSATERAAHIILFSNIVEDTPEKVPYWGGKTYSNLLTTYIPRAVWPNKPTENIGNEFGRRYRYLGTKDYSTSWNLPWIVEMYANFGSLGVLIGMPMVGVLLAFLEQKLNSNKMSSIEIVLGATMLFTIVYQESNLTLMIGPLVNISLALYCILNFWL